MTRSSVPRLTADSYTYPTYTSGDDYYGEIASKQFPLVPSRIDTKQESIRVPVFHYAKKKFTVAHGVSFIYCAVAFVCFVFSIAIWYNGITNRFVLYLGATMFAVLVTGVLMHIGIICLQPFICIPFVVLRTLEAFISAILLCLFSYALFDSKSSIFMFILQCTKTVAQLVSIRSNLNIVDATFQLCSICWFLSLALLSASIFVCRISFRCTMNIADCVRQDRCAKKSQSRQTPFSGDEFYYS